MYTSEKAYPPLKVRPASGALLSAIKEATGLSKVEIAKQSFDLFFDQLPAAQKTKVNQFLLDHPCERGGK